MNQERHAQILRLLQEHQTMSNDQLARAVFASLPTIRRDLTALERRGLVRRTRGGAALMEMSQQLEVPLSLRQKEQTQQKMQIARQALALVERGTTLFLDSSTTVYQLARILPTDMDLTVITNSIRVGALMTQKKIRTYILGGLLNDGFYSTGGTYAVEMAKQLRVDVMFFSANALTYEGEIMDFSENEARLRQEIIARSERTYFLCDSSKLGKTSLHHLCRREDVTAILCDLPLEEPAGRCPAPAKEP